jgi:hypothetical protein
MLPDMRAIFAALVAAVGLLMIAFGAVAALRVAQESHAGSFQTDLARRGQTVPAKSPQRVAIIETPGPHLAPPPPLPVVEVKIAPVGAEVSAIPLPREMDAPPVAVAPQREEEPSTVAQAPVGGPLAEPAPVKSEADRAAARAERAKKLAAAKKAREARIARQRKAAAVRRAAQARARQQAATSSVNNGFGNQSFGTSGFGSTFGKQ